jgi:hypothetical protein
MYCPNRWDLLGQLAELDQWAVNNTRTSLATVRQLNRTVGFSLGISWHIGYNADLQLGDNTVGAVYDAVSYELELPTYIDAFVYIGGNRSTWTADSWLHFKRKVADTICHEQIHVKQTIEVDDIDYTYLSNPRELDASSRNV